MTTPNPGYDKQRKAYATKDKYQRKNMIWGLDIFKAASQPNVRYRLMS